MKKLTTADIVARFVEVHGGRYDYSRVNYVGANRHVEIVCREHGPFSQSASSHIRGSGCPACAKLRSNTEKIIAEFRAVHGEKYDYSQFEYLGATTKSTIICPKHGPFLQTPISHKKGHGCRACYDESIASRYAMTSESFVSAAREKHNGRYEYKVFNGVNNGDLVTITCKEHGDFNQVVKTHLAGHGCPQCADKLNGLSKRVQISAFHDKFRSVHGDRYDYLGEEMGGDNRAKMKILCREHGEFLQKAADHIRGNGCPKCVALINPKANQEIAAFVESLGMVVEREARIFENKRRSVDVLVRDVSIAIEHNGVAWHSEAFHKDPKNHMLQKKIDAERAGFKLLHIMEDEWRYRRAACESLIRNAIGASGRADARSCEYSELPGSDKACLDFLDANHIQGSCRADFHAVLKDAGGIVMVIAIGQLRSSRRNTDRNKWEMLRMASSVQVRGGATKLMVNLLREHPEIAHITTYCDHRLFDGRTYGIMGFSKVAEYGPDYSYVIGDCRHHKSKFQKERIAKRFGVDMTDKTEREAMVELGYFRIWDCGKSRYEWCK